MALITLLKRSVAALVKPVALTSLLAASIPAVAEQSPNPALWKLEDEDSQIWLFGTIHILDPTLQWRTAKVSDAFDAADTLITEAPTNEADQSAMQQLVLKYGIDQTGQSFLGQLSPEADTNFTKVLQSMGQTEATKANFAQLRPWLVGVTLQVMQVQMQGGSPDAGVDNILWQEAKAKGKQQAYFETLEEQMQIFGSLSREDELYFFEAGLKQMVEEPDLLDEIIGLWVAGKNDELGVRMQETMVGMESLYDAMLTHRNARWAKEIKTLMDGEGTYFIAVGAGHLSGDTSVQNLLKQHGLSAVRQ